MTSTSSATARGVRRTTLPIFRSSSSTGAIAMTERPRYTSACLLRDAPPVAQPEPEEVPVLVERLVQEVELRGTPVLARVGRRDDARAHAVGEEAGREAGGRAQVAAVEEAPEGRHPESLSRDRVVLVGDAEEAPHAPQEELGPEPAEERAVLVPELLRAHDDVVGLEEIERGRHEGEVDRQIHVERDQQGVARAAHELAEGEPHAALRDVKERHGLEAAGEGDAERGGRGGRAVRADEHLVLAPEARQDSEQGLGAGRPRRPRAEYQ